MLPFRTPAMSPTPTVAGRPGSFESAKPRRIRIAATRTTMANAIRIGVAGRLASAWMPIGVAAQVPNSRSAMDRLRQEGNAGDDLEHEDHRNDLQGRKHQGEAGHP